MSESSTSPNSNGRALTPLAEPKEPILITQAGIQLTSIEQVWRMATLLHQSQLVPASFKTPQQLVVALLRAIELGLPPLQALEGMSVINNKVGLMGDLALSMVESSGQLESKRVEYVGEGDGLTCRVTLQRKGREPQTYSFSVKEARAAGIYDRSPTWRNYPRRMVYYRALGFGLRDEFADILKGTKTVEELMDYPVEELRSGRRVKVVQPVGPKKPEPTAKQNGNGAMDSKVVRQTMQPTNGIGSLEKVRQRLEQSKISEEELGDVLKALQLLDSNQTLVTLPDKTLALVAEHWETVITLVDELRERRKAEGK